MCLKDLLQRLRNEGLHVTEPQVRWAITSGKVNRPPLDGSLRFVFDQHHVDQLKAVLATREATK